MRKMMMVTSLVTAAACGSVEDPGVMGDETGSDMGSDSGSGSGSGTGTGSGSGSASVDAGMPQETGCMKAADCGANMACDLATHECVVGALTIDPTDFVVDANTWWT